MMLPRFTPSLFLLVFLLLSPLSLTLHIKSNLDTSLDFGRPLGINCRGSILCPQSPGFLSDSIGALVRITNGSVGYCPPEYSCGPLNDSEFYLPMHHIVCLPTGQSFLGGLCAFAQGSNVPAKGVTGALIKRKLRELREHGCLVCGSVPLGGNNDPHSQGILTVNYVSSKACKGLCPSTHYTTRLHSAANQSFSPGNSSLLLVS